MDKFLQILITYRHELISLVIGLIVILVTIFKKKVKFVDVIKTIILDCLPTAIREAELRYDNGPEKLDCVINLIAEWISKKFGIPVSDFIRSYHSFIKESVEDILSTPQKKER